MSDALMTVRGLVKHYPIRKGFPIQRTVATVKAVDGIDLDIFPGQTMGLVGESGSGKSTTARLITKLIEPTAGEITWQGEDPFIIHGIEANAPAAKGRVQELMEQVGLNPEHYNRLPHQFSGGQRQRIGIARALALKPKLIVADEPVSALDVSIQAQVLNLLRELQQELGLTIVFIAHDLSVVRYMCDSVAVMHHGKIVEHADGDELYANPQHPYTQTLLSAVPVADPVVAKERRAARQSAASSS